MANEKKDKEITPKQVMERMDKIEKRIDDLWARIRKQFDPSGKIFIGIIAFLLLGFSASAETVWQPASTNKGVLKADSSGGKITLTVDSIVSSGGASGDMTGDDINANGTKDDTLGINLDPTVDTNVLGTVTINGGRPSASVQDDDYFTFNKFSGNDGLGGTETNTEVYVSERVTTLDVTGGTEDGKYQLFVVEDGSLVEAISVTGDDVTMPGSLTLTGSLAVGGATASGSEMSLTNSANAGACSITSYADIGSDAGDMVRLLFGDGGGLAFQTDKASKGTLATKFTIGEAGRLTLVGSATLDNDTSASVLAIAETTIDLNGLTTTDEVDARTATPLLLGKATATGVTIGASDANTTVAGDLTVSGGDITATGNSAKIWLGTNGYFQVTGNTLEFIGHNGFTNAVDADVTQ